MYIVYDFLCVLICLIPSGWTVSEWFILTPKVTPQSSYAHGFPPSLRYFQCMLINHLFSLSLLQILSAFSCCSLHFFLKDDVSMLNGEWCRELSVFHAVMSIRLKKSPKPGVSFCRVYEDEYSLACLVCLRLWGTVNFCAFLVILLCWGNVWKSKWVLFWQDSHSL